MNNIENTLDGFIGEDSNESKVIQVKDGLIERVDRKYVISDGRQLLLESTY
jgi:hypothetical protein